MDVRCERCRAQYVFDDEQVTPQGLTVQCTNCGHVFRVKKKELVVTVPVRPEDVTEQPVPASLAAQRPAAAPPDAPPQGWTIRQAGGGTRSFTELTTLQKWIVERRVSRDDEVTQGDGAWVRLGDLDELRSFFEVVDAAERGRRAPAPPQAAPPPPRPPPRPGGTDFYPPPPFPPPGFPPPAAAPPPPRPAPPPAAARPDLTAELAPEELAAVRGRKGGRTRLAVAALLLTTVGAAAYVFGPALLGREPARAPAPPPQPAPAPAPVAAPSPTPTPTPVAVPLTIELKAPEEAKPAEGTPPAPAPAPPPAAEPAPAKAHTLKAQLAQAQKAREGGETARALDLYGRLLAAHPDNVDALTGRGLCYFELGQYAPAEASFQRALQLDLEHPDAIMGLAETYRQQGRKTEALALFERYLALHPDGEEAAVARYAISQLKE